MTASLFHPNSSAIPLKTGARDNQVASTLENVGYTALLDKAMLAHCQETTGVAQEAERRLTGWHTTLQAEPMKPWI